MKKFTAENDFINFSLPDQEGQIKQLSDYQGKWLILYFYPKDDTPGCTKEAVGFKELHASFKERSVEIIGVSADSQKKHVKFIEKYGLPFTLLSDENKTLINELGLWIQKKFMGREYMGIDRVTYLIDPEGKVRKQYEKVTPDKHAEEILNDIKKLEKANCNDE